MVETKYPLFSIFLRQSRNAISCDLFHAPDKWGVIFRNMKHFHHLPSFTATVKNNHVCALKDDLQVQPKTLTFNILQVKTHPFIKG